MYEIEKIGFEDLDGNWNKVAANRKEFANLLFKHAQSVEMDAFAREIHQNGKAKLNEQLIAELHQVIPTVFSYRVAQAILFQLTTK